MKLSRVLTSTPASIVQYLLVVGLIGYAAVHGAQSMGYNWQWYRMPQYFYTITDKGFAWGQIPIGLASTLILSAISFALAVVLGLVLALLRLSGLVVGQAVALGFLEIVRNTPILVLLYLFYYVLGPIFGLDRNVATILCLGVFHGVLISEIFRAGINAIGFGQWEAAQSIGMSTAQSYRYIVLPQSIRFMLPPMTGEAVHLVKNSAIASVIAVAELTTIGRNIISDTYMSFEIWFTVALVYLIVILMLSTLSTLLEHKYAVQQ